MGGSLKVRSLIKQRARVDVTPHTVVCLWAVEAPETPLVLPGGVTLVSGRRIHDALSALSEVQLTGRDGTLSRCLRCGLSSTGPGSDWWSRVVEAMCDLDQLHAVEGAHVYASGVSNASEGLWSVWIEAVRARAGDSLSLELMTYAEARAQLTDGELLLFDPAGGFGPTGAWRQLTRASFGCVYA